MSLTCEIIQPRGRERALGVAAIVALMLACSAPIAWPEMQASATRITCPAGQAWAWDGDEWVCNANVEPLPRAESPSLLTIGYYGYNTTNLLYRDLAIGDGSITLGDTHSFWTTAEPFVERYRIRADGVCIPGSEPCPE